MIIQTLKEISAEHRKNTPLLFVFEGVNGAGKSTLLQALSQALHNRSMLHTVTREPGGSKLGVKLRGILKEENKEEPITPLAELFLFLADRAQHAKKIRNYLAEGHIVLCDRFFYSSLAFQGAGSGINNETIESLSLKALDGILPRAVFLMDLNPHEGLARRAKESAIDVDRFESESDEYHARVRNKFLSLASSRPEPFVVINATLPKEEIASSVLAQILTEIAS